VKDALKTTGQPPSQQFLKRNVRTCLDLVQPAHKKIAKIAESRNHTISSYRTFKSSQLIYFLSGNPRINGSLELSLLVLETSIIYNERRFKRHVNQIRNRVRKPKTDGQTQYVRSENSADATERFRHIHFHGSTSAESQTRRSSHSGPSKKHTNIKKVSRGFLSRSNTALLLNTAWNFHMILTEIMSKF